jgi:uncharacterized protein (TIGR03084 family)
VQDEFSQPQEFLEECEALHALLADRAASVFDLVTQFKSWTIGDVIAHLHLGNRLVLLALLDPDRFRETIRTFGGRTARAGSMREATRAQLGDLHGRALLEVWREESRALAERFQQADPRARVPWVGPDMSVRTSVTARSMETWAHGQAVFDRLGVLRRDADRIRSIAELGIRTFGWSHRVRGLEVPAPTPRIRLAAPSGGWWEWNEGVTSELVEGVATEFCQVVTQTRALADTSLRVEGPIATRWMSTAQCFAGPPEDPPRPGTRYLMAPGVEDDVTGAQSAPGRLE